MGEVQVSGAGVRTEGCAGLAQRPLCTMLRSLDLIRGQLEAFERFAASKGSDPDLRLALMALWKDVLEEFKTKSEGHVK